MCPACIANAALMAGSVMSTGGIAAFVVTLVRGNLVRGKKSRNDDSKNETERKNDDGNDEGNQCNSDQHD
jgi:hypothetical protein